MGAGRVGRSTVRHAIGRAEGTQRTPRRPPRHHRPQRGGPGSFVFPSDLTAVLSRRGLSSCPRVPQLHRSSLPKVNEGNIFVATGRPRSPTNIIRAWRAKQKKNQTADPVLDLGKPSWGLCSRVGVNFCLNKRQPGKTKTEMRPPRGDQDASHERTRPYYTGLNWSLGLRVGRGHHYITGTRKPTRENGSAASCKGWRRRASTQAGPREFWEGLPGTRGAISSVPR